jgi:transposase InsO family protein
MLLGATGGRSAISKQAPMPLIAECALPRRSRTAEPTLTAERWCLSACYRNPDMTTTVTTGEGQVCVFVAVDDCTSECIGIHASKSGNRFEALVPPRQGVREHFGGFDKGIAAGLAIRQDHGSACMSDDFQRELAFLGMDSSPGFVREPEGSGVAERFVRTLKENLLWVRSFSAVEELVAALWEFKRRYNEEWLIERHGFRTPAQVRSGFSGPATAVA